MDIQVTLLPAGTTTGRELAELSAEVQDALRQRREVARVEPVRIAAPEGAKGIGELVGAFLLAVPPDAIKGTFDVLKGLLTRAPETPVTVEVSAGSAKVSFDPRRISAAEIGALVAQLRPASGI